jgi:hypothetical protein
MDFTSGMNAYAEAHQGFMLKPPPPTVRTGRWAKIYWIGLGSRSNGLHTKKEFLDIMRRQYSEVVYWRIRGERAVPLGKINKNDIEGWVQFTGARWI